MIPKNNTSNMDWAKEISKLLDTPLCLYNIQSSKYEASSVNGYYVTYVNWYGLSYNPILMRYIYLFFLKTPSCVLSINNK